MSAYFVEPSRDQIVAFVDALFRHADAGWASLRAFSAEGPWGRWETVPVRERHRFVDVALALATECALAPIPVVFCPPIATFKPGSRAREADVVRGLVLSVECDAWPVMARQCLEQVLGSATLVVVSGGEWPNPETGEIEKKIHLHWRLTEPSHYETEHNWLREARRLGRRIAGADASAVPISHPLRWAGSVHRKGVPRLARIVGGDPEREVALGHALALLRDAAGALPEAEHASSDLHGDIAYVASALTVLPNDDLPWEEWNRIGMATFAATGGSEEGLRLFEVWSRKSPKGLNPRPGNSACERWDNYRRYPPDRIGAGTLFYLAAPYFDEAEREFVRRQAERTVAGREALFAAIREIQG